MAEAVVVFVNNGQYYHARQRQSCEVLATLYVLG